MDDPGRIAEGLVDEVPLDEENARLRAELAAITRRAEEHEDLLRQTRADFADYRRGIEHERAELLARARIDLLLRVLAIFDAIQRAVAEPAEQRASPAWSGKVDQIERQLRDVLEAEGVQRIEALGALYNPWEHEALQHQASPELDDQRILAVVRDGYRIGDRVIRPAQVVVARRSQ